jgi:hypothetical protein
MSAPQSTQAAQDARLQAIGKSVAAEVSTQIQKVHDAVAEESFKAAEQAARLISTLTAIESRLALLEDMLQGAGGATPGVRATRPVAGAGGAKAGAKAVGAPKTGAARTRAAAAVGEKIPHNTMVWYELQMATNPEFQASFTDDADKSEAIGNDPAILKLYEGDTVPEAKLTTYWKTVGKLMWKTLDDKVKAQLKLQYENWKKTQAALHEAPPLGEDDEEGVYAPAGGEAEGGLAGEEGDYAADAGF